MIAADSEFGSAPSSEVPILFNDHTVFAKPDTLRKGRVLAAFTKNGQIYVPLRSMFEQMGATVEALSGGKTFVASKPGTKVSVTLGKPEVVLNGQTRPLDVPPIMRNGIVLVPIRVISEALGAYVQWVPEKRVVVVRYLSTVEPPPPAIPPPAPVATPTLGPVVPAPTAPSTPLTISTPIPYHGYIQAAFAAPRSYNEFSSGEYCDRSFVVSGAYLIGKSRFSIKGDYRQDVYVTSDNITDSMNNHYTSFSTIDGGTAFTPVFLARQTSLDGRLEYEIASPHINVGVGYLQTSNNYGYPHLTAVGAGIEKLADLRPGVRFYGSAFYYPNARGTYHLADPASVNAGSSYEQKYNILKYDVGLTLVINHSPIYVNGGFNGEHYSARSNAPISQTHDGPYLGLGAKI